MNRTIGRATWMPDPLPDRIWICGPTGAGKSTLARQLADAMGIEATEMDRIHWRPGWVSAPDDVIARDLACVTAQPRWVIEGNYSTYRRRHLARTQLHVWLDFPQAVSVSRVFRRTLRRAATKEPCCNGNRESLWRALFHKDSILLWAISHYRTQRRINAALLAEQPHVRLRTPSELTAWRRALLPGLRLANGDHDLSKESD